MSVDQDFHCSHQNADGSYQLTSKGRNVSVNGNGTIIFTPGRDYHIKADFQLWGGDVSIIITSK